MTGCAALIVAAGRGTRAGGDVPKQYRLLGGYPVLRHALMAFATHGGFSAVRAVIHPDDRALYERAADGLRLLAPVYGGATRQESVRLGLESLAEHGPDAVLIHDGARPLVSRAVIDRTLAALDASSGAIVALPVTDTLKRAKDGAIDTTVAREGLWRAQTPQGFRFAEILSAHQAAAGADLPDDAAVAERAGMAVTLVPGSERNLKITTDDDFARAAALLSGALEVRVGQGFDVHGFAPGGSVRPSTELRLCGVSVPHDRGLHGHSDADVGLHALTDAILGGLGAGDIGQHFPPSDARWRGADSVQFLRHAAELVRAAGGVIAHVDVTFICEAPKIGPHRAAMVARLAEILAIEPGRCSVKATTTEGLGFTGRGEGIAAQATATLRLPAPT